MTRDAARTRDATGVETAPDVWDARADLYRESEAHREGPDLDLIVTWAAGARTALDVATGGGHVARRLLTAGLEVVTTDRSPGMAPDVVCPAEQLPFAEASFDVVVTRVAAHHFEDVAAAVSEMARVAGDRVLVVDNLFLGDQAEEAERLRDPSHVRNHSEAEWRSLLESAGLRVESVERFAKPIELGPWFERAGTPEVDVHRVRELLADRIEDGWVRLDRIALKAVKR
jgi:ubiquinone/menaquinone biosynthesis C-methylase UbiE